MTCACSFPAGFACDRQAVPFVRAGVACVHEATCRSGVFPALPLLLLKLSPLPGRSKEASKSIVSS